jgi:hypothetical protein
MSSQALVLANNPALQQIPSPVIAPNSTLHEEPATSTNNKHRRTGGHCLKKGLDNLTKMIERKIDQQILLAQTRSHAASSSPSAPTNHDTKHVHWEISSVGQQAKA